MFLSKLHWFILGLLAAPTTVKCQTLTTFGIHIYIYFGGVWKGFGSEYIYLSYTVDCSFIRVSRGFGRVWFRIYANMVTPGIRLMPGVTPRLTGHNAR